MSDQVPVRYLRAFGRYVRGDMASLAREEVPRMLAAQVVALVERQATVETATTMPAERAVTRTTR